MNWAEKVKKYEEDQAIAIDFYNNSGMNMSQIAKFLKCSPTKVAKMIDGKKLKEYPAKPKTKRQLVEENEKLTEENSRLKILLADRVTEPAVTQSLGIVERYSTKLAGFMQERFYVLLLDNKHRIIEEIMVTQGTLNQSLVHPREVFAAAVEKRAAAVILLHNHPSGDPTPSPQDNQITDRLREAGTLLGIPVLDHIIIAGKKYFSFVDEGIF